MEWRSSVFRSGTSYDDNAVESKNCSKGFCNGPLLPCLSKGIILKQNTGKRNPMYQLISSISTY